MSLNLKIDLLRVGHTRQREVLARKDRCCDFTDFPALCALIRHPNYGAILYDTGYETRLQDATKSYPLKFYHDILPVYINGQERLTVQLEKRGISPKDIQNIVVSHFHADHIAGLKDFPSARFICFQKEYGLISRLSDRPWRSLFHGFVEDLIPDDFGQKALFVETLPLRPLPLWMKPFEAGYDLFGDSSVLGISLPGHTSAQLGLFLPETDKGPVFLVGDACWSLPACRNGVLPSSLALWTASDRTIYKKTFFCLRELANREPGVRIVPSHCIDTWKAWHV